MLERLRIRNFQKHEDFSLVFDPHVTCLVGSTDQGKSAIIRSLRWLATNRPSGDSFIRWGAKRCAVSLVVDGRKITRRKGNGNVYLIDGKKLSAVGREVPVEISSLLNLSPVNFQSQHDAPWWLSLSAGQVSKELNAVVDLAAMDAALGLASAELRKAKARAEVCRERLGEARAERDALSWVPEREQDFIQIERKFVEMERVREKRARIGYIVEDGQRVASAGENAAGEACAIRLLVSLGDKLLGVRRKADEASTVIQSITVEHDRMSALDREAGSVRADLERLLADRCPLCGAEKKS